MTTLSMNLPRALRSLCATLFAPALALCGLAFLASAAHADPLTFSIDSTQSFLTLNIPNFTISTGLPALGNLTLNLQAQNRTNGAPLSTPWSASTNTGNTAFISGTIATTVGGSFTGQTLSAIQFIAGANNLTALSSGNYRPNPAAYNAITSAYNSNAAGPGAYGSLIHGNGLAGNAALTSFDNVVYDIGTNALLPTSNTVNSGTFAVNDLVNPINTGILSSLFSVQPLGTIAALGAISNEVTTLPGLVAGDIATTLGTYTFTSPTNLQITIPLVVPVSISLGGGTFINGLATGQFVANATVPEPSTLALAGLGMVSLVALARRRRKMQG